MKIEISAAQRSRDLGPKNMRHFDPLATLWDRFRAMGSGACGRVSQKIGLGWAGWLGWLAGLAGWLGWLRLYIIIYSLRIYIYILELRVVGAPL